MTDILCIIHRSDDTGFTAAQDVHVNGKAYPIAYNVPVTLAPEAIEVLKTSGAVIEILPAGGEEAASPGDPASADAAAAGDPGGDSSGGAAFDAEAIIVGNIADIDTRLGTLTPEQLAAVEAAEIDREKPRKGVMELIAKAREATTAEAPKED